MSTKTKRKGYIINHPQKNGPEDNLQLLRITITSSETKVDFGYQATDYYHNGGWIKISPDTFIRPSGTKKKFILKDAKNIPYGPEKLHFNSTMEWRYFSLIFPALPDGTEYFDLIEKEHGDATDFNLYQIDISEKAKKLDLY